MLVFIVEILPTDRGNSDGIPTPTVSLSEFCKIPKRLSNGYNISSEFIGFFRGNPILCFLGISSEIPRYIPRISFSVGMSVRISLFSCSVLLDVDLKEKLQPMHGQKYFKL